MQDLSFARADKDVLRRLQHGLSRGPIKWQIHFAYLRVKPGRAFAKANLRSKRWCARQGRCRKSFLVAKYVSDTDLYTDFTQSRTTLPFVREIYDKDTSGI
jgi:hypothetical protein